MADPTNLETSVIRAHPWHGVDPLVRDSDHVIAFVETVQFDTMKYEIDRETGLMRIERAHQTSSLPPYSYGFIPRTLCGPNVAGLSNDEHADGAPLDVYVLSERPIMQRGVLARIRIVGGFPVSDNGLADDKLVGVISSDGIMGSVDDIDDVPVAVIDRIAHHLNNDTLTDYVHVGEPYGRALARQVLDAAMEDYRDKYA